MSEGFYRPASYVEYRALWTLYRAGVKRVYVRFDWTEYGERELLRRADNFSANRENWEAIGLMWNYLESALGQNIDVVVEAQLFSGELGIEFLEGAPWGYFRGWLRMRDWKKETPDVELRQEIEPTTEMEKLLWEAKGNI